MPQTILRLSNIHKSFGATEVLKNINLDVQEGEFITLLGPSGCGKTTTLRIIAGLEEPTSGTVYLENEDVTQWEPNHRNVNTVFQNYALFPHMSVAKNIGYSQRIRRVDKKLIEEEVDAALHLVQLEEYGERMPNQLSGGQMQRVAIARAIINQPKVLLLDEPLGALDLQLRYQMQTELKTLQRDLGITFIYITHDQEEALNMSDRIVVMNAGRFEQIGTSLEIYDNPKTSFVAEFVGRANRLVGDVKAVHKDYLEIKTHDTLVKARKPKEAVQVGDTVTFIVRREYATVACEANLIPEGESYLSGTVVDRAFTSGSLTITVSLADGTEFVSSHHLMGCPTKIGDEVFVTWDTNNAVLVDLEESL